MIDSATDRLLDDDGMPMTPAAAKSIGRLKGYAASIGGWLDDAGVVARCSSKATRPMVEQLLVELRAANAVVQGPRGRWVFFNPRRNDENSTAARTSNYDAVLDGIAARFSDDLEVRARTRAMLKRLRRVYGLHRFVRDGRSMVVVPTAVRWTIHGHTASEALAFVFDDAGVHLLELGPDCFGGDGRQLVHEPDPRLGRPAPDDLQQAFALTVVSPFSGDGIAFGTRISNLAKGCLASAFDDRTAMAFALGVGEEHDENRWIGLRRSTLLARSLGSSLRRTLWSVLDPVVRRAAVGLPHATYAIYSWLSASDAQTRLRRVQAARSYPLLVETLPRLAWFIDSGKPLAEPLAALLGLPVHVLRRMRGLTWQRVGHAYHQLSSMEQDLAKLLSALPPGSFPERNEWDTLAWMQDWIRSIGWLAVGPVLIGKALKDPRGFMRKHAGFRDSFTSTLRMIRLVRNRTWEVDDEDDGDDGLASALMDAICGPQRSLKRLEAFDIAWHRQSAALTSLMTRLYRLATDSPAMKWSSPVGNGFDHPAGRLDWILDEDRLEIEGMEMSHCVGSYGYRCASRRSFVASVRAADGGRSTVEFAADLSKAPRLLLMQNQARGNTVPTLGCVEVVDAFLAGVNRRGGGLTKRRLKPRPIKTKQRTIDRMSEADAAALLEAYDALAPGLAAAIEGIWEQRPLAA